MKIHGKNRKAIVLCSGGLDSVVLAHYVRNRVKYSKIMILFFDYGQKSLLEERKFSQKCAKTIDAKFIEIKLNGINEISSSLINKPGKIRKITREDLKDSRKESAKWYVPFRNGIFLSYALALSDSLNKKSGKIDIYFGFKSEGKESYPDSTLDFVRTANKLARSSESRPNVVAPFIKMDKEDIISLGNKMKVDFRNTFSCYVGKKSHCGHCLACKLRQEGFYWANARDPTEYKE